MHALQPIYTPHNCTASYQLDWSLSLFWKTTPPSPDTWLAALSEATPRDRIHTLNHRFASSSLPSPAISQFLVSSAPDTAPDKIIRSVKGRLQHLIRERVPKAFQRNYSLRSIGSTRREKTENYVASQMRHHPMADPSTQSQMEELQVRNSKVDLAQPRFTDHGEFWYNLHIVVVFKERWVDTDWVRMTRVRDMIVKASEARGTLLSRAGPTWWLAGRSTRLLRRWRYAT